jgi:hypothetical protein
VQALQIDEIRRWCDESPSGVRVAPSGHLRYATHDPYGIRLDVPSEAAKVVALVSSLLAVEQEDGFYGAFMWFTNFDTGTPRIERCGLRILEQMRRGYGVTPSIENAPGQLFRTDEMVDAHAFLTLPLLFGWDAYFMPHGTRYIAYARQNASLFLVTDGEPALQKLMTSLEPYHPVLELPAYLRGENAER